MVTTVIVVMLTMGLGGMVKMMAMGSMLITVAGSVKPVGQAGHGIHGGLMDYGGLTMADI